MFLDNGLKDEALEDYIGHFYTDTGVNDGFYEDGEINE